MTVSREAVAAALNGKIGPPDARFTLFDSDVRSNLSDEFVVLAVGTLHQPDSEDSFVYLVTNGLSQVETTGERVELCVRCDGAFSGEAVARSSQQLASLAARLAHATKQVRPGDIVENTSFALFPGRTNALLTDFNIYGPDFLDGVEPSVRLLSVRAIYDEEVDWVRTMSPAQANDQFRAAGATLADPTRKRVLSPPQHSNREPGGVSMAEAEIVREAWAFVERWFAQHSPSTAEDLNEPADAAALDAIEKQVGKPLPKGLRTSLEIHDGKPSIASFRLLRAKQILERHARLTERGAGKAADVDARLEQVEWHKGWIPFAEDSGGNLYAVDLAPTPKGSVGQVITWDQGSRRPSPTTESSFADWFQKFRQGLEANEYFVDEDGFVIRK